MNTITIYKDGNELKQFQNAAIVDIIGYMHTQSSHSMQWAIMYEGFTIKKVENGIQTKLNYQFRWI